MVQFSGMIRTKFTLLIAVAFILPLPLFSAGKVKTSFHEETLSAGVLPGGFVQSAENGVKNARDVPIKTRGAIVRTRKETIFGGTVSDDALLFRKSLPKNQRDAYDELFTALSDWKRDCVFSARISKSELGNVILAVTNDNPEIFWWAGEIRYWYNSDSAVTKVEFKYLFPESTAQELYDEFFAMSVPIAFYASRLESDMEKIKYVHDYLCLSIDYDYESFNSGNYGGKLQTAWSAIVEYKTVCAGYSRAFQYYMQQLGIPCAVIESDSHAWNILKVNGKCYEMDVTWDDNHLYPPYFNLQHSEMCALDFHTPDAISREIISGNPDGDRTMSYSAYFGGLPQGEPYTYREFSNIDKDIENPAGAVIFKNRPSSLAFVGSAEDVENAFRAGVQAAQDMRFTVKFVARTKEASQIAQVWLSDSGNIGRILRKRFPNCGYSYKYSYSGGESEVSYKIEVSVTL